MQQGQSLNALLGYLFEDSVHARNLDKYIQPFRDAYPVSGQQTYSVQRSQRKRAASNVVDGVALRTAWDGGKLPTGQAWGTGLPGPGADQNAVIAVLQTLDDYADALADLSIAEAVFQVIRGNFGRGGGLIDAISRGSRPPTPDVVDTPRGGIDLTHRVTSRACWYAPHSFGPAICLIPMMMRSACFSEDPDDFRTAQGIFENDALRAGVRAVTPSCSSFRIDCRDATRRFLRPLGTSLALPDTERR